MVTTSRLLQIRDRARAAVDARNALSQWAVNRPTGGGTTDPATGDWIPAETPVWSGDAHFSEKSRPFVRDRTDAALTIQGPTLCVSVDAPPFAKGDTVALVSGGDPSLQGRMWRITATAGTSYAIHRHYPLEEVTP